MHIEFRGIEIHNFMSFGHAQLAIQDDGFIKVTGINENPDDLATSNGSGKSSLWESIVWALTGETIRGTKQVSNIYGDDGTYVIVEFLVDNTHYEITRSKDHKILKTTLKIVIDGNDVSGKGIRDSEKLLAQYLPDITASLLGSVIILGQGLPQKFTNNTPSGRKEVLEKLSKSDFMIEDLKARVASRKQEISSELRNYQDACLQVDSKIRLLNQQITDNQARLSTMDETALKITVTELSEKKSDLSDKLTISQDELSTIKTSIQALLEDGHQRLTKYNEDVQSINHKHQESIEQARDEMVKLQTEHQNATRELTRIQNIKDICPTCGQKISGVHKPDTTQLEQTISDLKLKLAECTNVYNDRVQLRTDELNALKKEYDLFYIDHRNTLMREEDLKREKTTQIASLTQNLNMISNQLDAETRKLDQFVLTVKNLEESIATASATIETLNQELLYNNTNKDLQQTRLDVISKFDTALKRDFRGYLLTAVIDYIQVRAKAYAQKIFETDKIAFMLDGNNIEISYLNKSYENLSGGEKQKIDLIIQFSIRDMLCNHLGFTSNILVLDEVFDGLDMIGCQRVLDVISAISDIKNIFIVTHRKDLSIPSDKEIIVVKSSDGISELR